MSVLRMIYLCLAILGGVLPLRQTLDWFAVHGWSVSALVDRWITDAASRGLAADLAIAAVALTVWALAEIWVRRNWLALVAIPAAWILGPGCGLPLYLFLRTRRI